MKNTANTDYFAIGSVYRNRRGRYEVLQIEPQRIFIKYDDGSEEWADKKISERIARNIILEDVSKIPPGINTAETSDFFWTIGALAAKGDFQAEIPPQSWLGFWNDYTRITGIPASPSATGISRITHGGQNKWGCELRIYFPSSFYLTAKQWIEKTNAIGLISKSGRYGGTFAHKDIAFEFASWVSVEFKLYLIKEF